MAGRGPAPKRPDARARRAAPARGEWTTLPAEPFEGDKPHLPRVRGGLLAQTKRAWDIWWSSPMAHRWTEADWPRLLQAVVVLDKVTRALNSGEFFNGFASMQTELRHLLDSLGLTEKGRRDLRWELPDGDEAPELASVTSISSRSRPDPRRRA